MNANEILFRCSSLGHIMTDGNKITDIQLAKIDELQSKDKRTDKQQDELTRLIYKRDNPELSAGCKTHLVDVYVRNAYNRFTEVNAKMLDKGNEVEEDSITIVSRIKKKMFKKNEIHLKNEFITGTPDLFEGEAIDSAEEITDTKSSWDSYTFFRAKYKELESNYYWQGTGYMALTGAKKCTIAYCLNNTPYHLVEAELRKESYKHLNMDTPSWIEIQIIANHVYDEKTFHEYIQKRGCFADGDNARAVIAGFVEIPLKERYHEFVFERNEEDINRLYYRVRQCREYMNQTFFNQQTQAA